MGLIKYCKDFEPKRENVIKTTYSMDLTISAFHIAWTHVNLTNGQVLRPKNIYSSFFIPEMTQILAPVLAGDYCIIANNETDEWWMDFEDSDLIFYSPGA